MERVVAIALNTFRESIRDRIIQVAFLFGILLELFALALGELALHEKKRITRDIGLASLSLVSIGTFIFLGSSLLHKELERKTLYVILPKPIWRHELIVGKYFGLLFSGIVIVFGLGAFELMLLNWMSGMPDWAFWGALILFLSVFGLMVWKRPDLTPFLPLFVLAVFGMAWGIGFWTKAALLPSVLAITLIFLEISFLSAVALFFSSFSSPFLTGALTFGMWLLGRSADEMAEMRSKVLPEWIRLMLRGLAWVVPNFHLYVPPHRLLSGLVQGEYARLVYLAKSTFYAAIYSAFLIWAACHIFRKRDLI
ncbi:MAG: hypothetical protein NZM37_02130 [Sandaracinaceae bacterium]|nr:hypothetical protein [Sandaracinaceae bacterium]MDW8246645.1 hypothetical protein [Sandaracinaceae bacterium]